MTKKVEEIVQEQSAQTLHLRHRIRELQQENKGLLDKIGAMDEFAESCASTVVAADPFPRFQYTNASRSGKPIVAVLDFSDWHIGEIIKADETQGFNQFDYATAERRIFGIISDFLKWVEIQRAAYRIDECRICAKGDYVSGDIHPELQVTNEFPLPEQTVKAGLLLGECVRRIAGHFKAVIIEAVGADNHGRLTRKPQAKQKTTNNMSFIVHAMAVSMTSRCNNVVWNVARGMKHLATINGFKYLIEHGDNIRGHMGIPYYGFQRMVGKEATRRMNSDQGFHYLSIGHFHVPALIEDRIIVNGSLSGTSEFDHSQGRHARPSQAAHFVHPVHGIFNLTSFKGI